MCDLRKGAVISARERLIRRIRDLLRASLLGGMYGTRGLGKLPSETDLMLQFHVARDVVREALDSLRLEGVIERRQGLGTLVTSEAIQMPSLLPPAGSTLEVMLRQGRIASEILDWGIIPVPATVVDHLDGLTEAARCLFIDYLLIRNGSPIAVITNYMRGPDYEVIHRENFTSDYYSLLTSSGLSLSEHSMIVEACAAEPRAAALMGIAVGEPVMWFEQVLHNERGERFNFATGTYRRDVRTSYTGTMATLPLGLEPSLRE
jgi:GntR family transcriptional regulator